jgi:hypothetical protein
LNERLNEIRRNNKGTPMKIIRYGYSQDIDVEFLDEHHYIKENQTYLNFKRGSIKNPYDKNICGVGYLGDGEFKCKHPNGIHTTEYRHWISLIRRCYDEARKDTYPAYYGNCEVCKEWHNFQTFAQWYNENMYQVGTERMHVDKDILYPGNKIYSPQKCLIIPQRINMIFTNKSNERGLPNGITHYEIGYSAKYNTKELGVYETLEEAYLVYAQEKEKHIRQVADEYKELIPEHVYKALCEYKVYMEHDKNIQAA